ncbi:MAG: L,D-transpeptidase [Polyangiaceae bacterium]|nr:L,D-transpeptidase [Polyangiaceae bacterium]
MSCDLRVNMAFRRAALGAPALVSAALIACGHPEDPPGRSVELSAEITLPLPDFSAAEKTASPSEKTAKPPAEPGSGDKIASIAMRTWIYVAPDDRSTKLGYLRAGAVVDRALVSAGTDGCAGGWYRIVPRGYVCVGKGASLSLDHPVVQAAVRGPDRTGAIPYHYVISRSPPPHLYFKLPSKNEQERAEGRVYGGGMALWPGIEAIPVDPVPAFLLAGNDLPKPYGADKRLHYAVHAGRANEASAFGLITTFEWTNRRFGLTTELDIIPLDRTKPAVLSALQGVVMPPPPAPVKASADVDGGTEPSSIAAAAEPEGRGRAAKKKGRRGAKGGADEPAFPIPALVNLQVVSKFRRDERGNFREDGTVPFRSGWALTGKNNGSPRGLLETTEGFWLPAEALLIPTIREDPAGFAREGKKWIDVSIRKQMLVAYEGRRPVFATIVSTGIGELGDPEKTHATIRGTFLIHAKHVSGTMDGDEASTDSFDLRDVPYIQYFHKGYALHGAYWHDEFGKARSHGCVNLAPADAAWLFEWTDPIVPPEWHGAVNAEGGTLVYTHP